MVGCTSIACATFPRFAALIASFTAARSVEGVESVAAVRKRGEGAAVRASDGAALASRELVGAGLGLGNGTAPAQSSRGASAKRPISGKPTKIRVTSLLIKIVSVAACNPSCVVSRLI